jgi:polysaccharide pyruvyl transferase WcaK-like protein
MKKILLMDTLSTIHVGNGALLENTIKLCRDAYGECEFHIITMDKETNKLKYDSNKLYDPIFGKFWIGLGRIGKIKWAIKNILFMVFHILNEKTLKINSVKFTYTAEQRNAIEAIERSDICVSCGGEIINDGFYQALPFWLFSYWLSIKKGKKFVLFPQSIGPLEKFWTRKLTYYALKNGDLFFGRDEKSFKALLSIGLEEDRVMFVPDVAIQQEKGEADINSYFSENTKDIIGVTISNPPSYEMSQKIDFVAVLSAELSKLDSNRYKILIMPSNYKLNEVSADYSLCLNLKKELSSKFEVSILENRPYFPGEYAALLANLVVFISTRMHVAILSTVVRTPTIAINTQHKIKGYMKNVDMEEFCIEYNELNNVHIKVLEIIKNRNIVKKHLKEKVELLKDEHKPLITALRSL